MITSVPGALNTTAAGVLDNIDVTDQPYVLFRSGDYTTVLAYGDDLTLLGSVISGSADYVLYNQRGYVQGTNYYPTIAYGTDTVRVDLSSSMYYTNVLSHSPQLEGGVQNAKLSAIGLAVSSVLVFLVLWNIAKHAVFRLPNRLR